MAYESDNIMGENIRLRRPDDNHRYDRQGRMMRASEIVTNKIYKMR